MPDSRFDRDTAVEPAGAGRFRARIDPSWWIRRGPNGGYLAALLLRALERIVEDPARQPRSLTVHYLRAPHEGPADIEARVERAGRTVSHATARLAQDGALQLLATAVLSDRSGGLGFQDAAMPEVPPPEDVPIDPAPAGISIRAHFERRPVFGAASGATAASRARVGGWIRLADPRPYDAPLLAQLSDAWSPALFAHPAAGAGGGAPTLDLTVHFRAPDVVAALAPDEPVLVTFESRFARDGFVEEDGEVWSRGGVLLAHSRQLALVV